MWEAESLWRCQKGTKTSREHLIYVVCGACSVSSSQCAPEPRSPANRIINCHIFIEHRRRRERPPLHHVNNVVAYVVDTAHHPPWCRAPPDCYKLRCVAGSRVPSQNAERDSLRKEMIFSAYGLFMRGCSRGERYIIQVRVTSQR